MSDPSPPFSQTPGAPLRILVADDDPVSRGFFDAALRQFGCDVTSVGDGDAAIAAARGNRFDLLLLDRRMPGLGGAPLLAALRQAGVSVRAIATSADVDAAVRDTLIAAGFEDVLRKPVGIDALARVVSAPSRGGGMGRVAENPATVTGARLLDDASALAAVGGDRQTVAALRALLARDLDEMIASEMPADWGAFAEALHRLRAACRYCGAASLERAATALEAAIRAGGSPSADAHSAFRRCCERTRAAIAG
jgi:CheY-like chemotaxis protein